MTTQSYGLYVGRNAYECNGDLLSSISPINNTSLTMFRACNASDIQGALIHSREAFELWRTVPAPQRGELIRQLGNVFRERKKSLAGLITLEMGKVSSEAEGEIQEVIDICDFAVGLSRQLYGLTIASERSGHRLTEQWHPLGVVGVITAFNFPMAVWAWNIALAIVCGNSVVWKPSERTPLCAIACQMAFVEAVRRVDFNVPEALSILAIGFSDVGKALAQSSVVALVSATGSTKMGKSVATTVGARLGRSLLELGGNAAMIVAPSADLAMAAKAATFSAVGTTGQRCTSLRRLIVHHSVYDEFLNHLALCYGKLKVGDPRDPNVHVGPLVDLVSKHEFIKAREFALTFGTRVIEIPINDEASCYAGPIVVEVTEHHKKMNEEVFAPLLYLMRYDTIEEAIVLNNCVPQGLSSTIMTNDVREAELFCSSVGSDCGLANVNIGTSGAEIGGAFGGDKETGGGREAGSDAWKNYMRRQTNTVNYSGQLPLAQGVKFDI